MRTVALLAFALLAACDFSYGVRRIVDVPIGFDRAPLEAALREHADYSVAESDVVDEDFTYSMMRDGDAFAVVICDDEQLSVASVWFPRPPSAEELAVCVRFQGELIRLLRTIDPLIPVASDWAVDWIRMDGELDVAAVDASVQVAR